MTAAAKPILAILGGTGQEGRALASRWAHAGYPVIIGSRDAAKAAATAESIKLQCKDATVTGSDLTSAARAAEIVVLTVPHAAQLSTLGLVKPELNGKLLVDVTVPLVPPKVSRVQLPEGGSAVVQAQALLGDGVKVVSAFQNISHASLGDLAREIDCDVLVCGDDKDARERVIALARDAGMRAWHCGPLANSAAVEAMTSLLIFLNIRHKVHGTGIKLTGLDNKSAKQLSLIALPDIPEVRPGDHLPDIIMAGLAGADTRLADGDVVVIAQKVVSKSENRYANLADVEPSPRALEMAQRITKDPRIVELILRESRDVVRQREDLIVVEHRHGYVLANAGIDVSNLEPLDGQQRVLLLPENPDASAASIRAELEKRTGKRLAVVINDSLGRAWRKGTVGTALGASGLPTLLDMRGQPDRSGRALRSTEVGVADEVAAAASLLMGQAAEGRPIVILRGFPYALEESNAAALIRSKEMDMFR
jgi:coenzyme F420-0:L-glutamate ligase/coenzyme F420-1:gamma-L-glutamate ligase